VEEPYYCQKKEILNKKVYETKNIYIDKGSVQHEDIIITKINTHHKRATGYMKQRLTI
jgi:hypothetical protein